MSILGKVDIPAGKFYEIFRKYDADGNNYIEAGELDNFVIDMMKEAQLKDDPSAVKATKEKLLAKYDANFDGKISSSELARILVPEKNFLVQFGSDITLTSVDFMKVWRRYDADNNGRIEGRELEGFLHDLLTRESGKEAVDPSKLRNYKKAMLQLFDEDKDKAFSLSELAEILPVGSNFLSEFKITQSVGLSAEDFEKIADHYDQDKSGFFERVEMEGIVHDLLDQKGKSIEGVADYTDQLYRMLSIEKTGKVSKAELRMVLTAPKE